MKIIFEEKIAIHRFDQHGDFFYDRTEDGGHSRAQQMTGGD
jgi:hypothetical protein